MEMDIPQQASWMVRKIIEAREIMQQLPTAYLNQSSIKQIYLGMLGNHSKVTWRTLMFHNEARPKARFTMWMQCHGRLMTADRLANWGIQISTRCCLCNEADESHTHLFCECSFTKAVRGRLMQWLRIQVSPNHTYTQMMAWITTQAKGKSCAARVMKMVYAEHIYGIWRERNSRIFEEISRTTEQVAREVACVCNARAQGGMRAKLQQLMF
ncbi:PREDICTED: uncharacterized protein LOC109230014 [Nicotiana attenuata]|uniref:uncharacterized protein LOC109230014 n=1 Tax=Nicotiana attenuata TaxID=49451 RepID=UPI0009051E67|nr:PREDICTED: uncharacterized protein LOC109230014 [Nicotiana attenuata]